MERRATLSNSRDPAFEQVRGHNRRFPQKTDLDAAFIRLLEPPSTVLQEASCDSIVLDYFSKYV